MDRALEQGDRPLSAPSARAALLLAPLGVLLLALFLTPEVGMLAASFGPGWDFAQYGRFFRHSQYLSICGRTLLLGGGVAAINLLLGVPTAYWLARIDVRRGSALLLLFTFPLWVSAIVRSFAWVVLLGRGGVLSRILQALGLAGHSIYLLQTTVGVGIALTQVMLPVVVLGLYGVFRGINPELERAARTLGAAPIKVMALVTLPLARNGIQSSGLLVFALSCAAFTTPSIVGGARVQLMSTTIYEQIMELSDWPFASAIACILLTVSLVVALVYGRLTRDEIAQRQ